MFSICYHRFKKHQTLYVTDTRHQQEFLFKGQNYDQFHQGKKSLPWLFFPHRLVSSTMFSAGRIDIK